jgi:hypothetical protein
MLKTSYLMALVAAIPLAVVYPARATIIDPSSTDTTRLYEFKGNNVLCTSSAGPVGSCMPGGSVVFDFELQGAVYGTDGSVSENSLSASKALTLINFFRPLNYPPFPADGGAIETIYGAPPSLMPPEIMDYAFSASGLNFDVGQKGTDYLLSFSASVKQGISSFFLSFFATPDRWFLHTQNDIISYDYSGTAGELTRLQPRVEVEVPEPGGLSLLAVSLACIALVKRNKSRSKIRAAL